MFESQDEAVVRFRSNKKEFLITSEMAELYNYFISCNIPTKYEFMATERDIQLQLNYVQSFIISLVHSVDSYNEHNTDIITN